MSKIIRIILLLIGISATSRCSLIDKFFPQKICCLESADKVCFTKDPPFQYMPLPECADDSKVKYTMYTREKQVEGEPLNETSIPSIFKGKLRTVFVAHGFIENEKYRWMTVIKDAFLKREDMNVVIIDWSTLGSNPDYTQSASNTRTVGAFTAVIIRKLLQQPNTKASRFWCTGHSLGSHVCGHTGMHMPVDQALGRVTGLDPAGPLFEHNPDVKIGINPTSGMFVDIIWSSDILGTRRRLGHIEFYPTGHLFGIDFSFKSAWELGIICDPIMCAHKRSVDFMITSLLGTDTCFATDMHCTNESDLPDSCTEYPDCIAYMGYRAEESCNKTGRVYLKVPSSPPFCRTR